MGIPCNKVPLNITATTTYTVVHSGRPKVIDPKFSRNIWNILPNNTVTKPHLHIVVQDPRGQRDQLFCLSHVTESAGESRMPRPLRPPPPPPASWWERRSWYGGSSLSSSLLSVMIVRTMDIILADSAGMEPLPHTLPSSLRYHHPLCAPLLSMHPPMARQVHYK